MEAFQNPCSDLCACSVPSYSVGAWKVHSNFVNGFHMDSMWILNEFHVSSCFQQLGDLLQCRWQVCSQNSCTHRSTHQWRQTNTTAQLHNTFAAPVLFEHLCQVKFRERVNKPCEQCSYSRLQVFGKYVHCGDISCWLMHVCAIQPTSISMSKARVPMEFQWANGQ